ncbi:MAG: cell division protein SepF [Actinomycetota bacterium]
MSVFRRAMLYLGLGADEDYDEFGQPQRPPGAQAPMARPRPVPPSSVEPGASVRTLPPEPAVRPVPSPAVPQGESDGPDIESPSSSGVRTVPPPAHRSPTVITPTSFNEAKQIGDHFKSRQPVIINLQNLSPELGHRLVDFAAGLIYALDGKMEKVADNVFLLKPTNMELGDDDRRRLAERGLAD